MNRIMTRPHPQDRPHVVTVRGTPVRGGEEEKGKPPR
jgi:hypothetical protein